MYSAELKVRPRTAGVAGRRLTSFLFQQMLNDLGCMTVDRLKLTIKRFNQAGCRLKLAGLKAELVGRIDDEPLSSRLTVLARSTTDSRTRQSSGAPTTPPRQCGRRCRRLSTRSSTGALLSLFLSPAADSSLTMVGVEHHLLHPPHMEAPVQAERGNRRRSTRRIPTEDPSNTMGTTTAPRVREPLHRHNSTRSRATTSSLLFSTGRNSFLRLDLTPTRARIGARTRVSRLSSMPSPSDSSRVRSIVPTRA